MRPRIVKQNKQVNRTISNLSERNFTPQTIRKVLGSQSRVIMRLMEQEKSFRVSGKLAFVPTKFRKFKGKSKNK
jgi:hypothetical protein